MTEYNTERLAQLGRRRRKLYADLAENRREIIPEIVEARRADVPQGVVAGLSGYAREHVRRIEREHGIGEES